ncbi:hypothetical protein ACOBR2_17585 [Telmatobacter bradus]|uniref:hypothetical protein n=1 Tax=Telmatobacter bradus TaxID=474953 RepID=UPI003B430A8A
MLKQESRSLPEVVKAPAHLRVWQRRALLVALLGALAAALLAVAENSTEHLLRAWLLGFVFVFGFAVGGLALLMVQYCASGHWSLLLRRPLEAMSRTLPLVFVYWIVVVCAMKRLYLWARIADANAALRADLINSAQAHCIEFKRVLLNPTAFVVASLVCFAAWSFFAWRLHRLAQKADEDLRENAAHWLSKLARYSAPGLVVVVLTVTAATLYWIMSLDVTWASSIFGLLLLVGLASQALALATFTVLALAKDDPYKTVLRIDEQHDMGKMVFAFVMLNVYLAFSQFLIVWSGNLPEEASWYLDRMRGVWSAIMALDCIFAWLVPFLLLLSRDLKRNRKRLMAVCAWILFARAFDLFWMIEPSFKDAARNLHFSWGLLEYVAVPIAMVALWTAYFLAQLQSRPLLPINDPLWHRCEEGEHD